MGLQWVWGELRELTMQPLKMHGVSFGPFDMLGIVGIVETAVFMHSLILCCIQNEQLKEKK